MLRGIVIGTHDGQQHYLDNLLRSFKGYNKYPILICSEYNWEVGKIEFAFRNTSFDEFIFLPHSCEIKDPSIFEKVFACPGNVSLFNPPYQSFMGKYQRKWLEKMVFPRIHNKREAVQAEKDFTRDYMSFEKDVVVIDPPLENSNKFTDKFGRRDMICENNYLIKYKGCWSDDMIKD